GGRERGFDLLARSGAGSGGQRRGGEGSRANPVLQAKREIRKARGHIARFDERIAALERGHGDRFLFDTRSLLEAGSGRRDDGRFARRSQRKTHLSQARSQSAGEPPFRRTEEDFVDGGASQAPRGGGKREHL